MASTLNLTLRINADGSAAIAGVRNVTKETRKFGPAAQQAGEQAAQGFGKARAGVQSISEQLKEMQQGMLALAGLHFGKEMIADIVEANSKLQGWKYGLEAATGSQQKAAEALAFVRAESNRLGISLEDSASTFTRLAAATKNTALEGAGAQKVFTGVAEAARTLHLSGAETNSMLIALDQMMSKGTVQAQELKLQMGNVLPGAMHVAAEAMGVTVAQLDKMMEQGKLVSDDFLPKFAARLHELYGATAADAATSPAAQLERLKNAVFELKAAIGDAGFMASLASKASLLTSALTALVQSGALDVIVRGLLAIASSMAAAWVIEKVLAWTAGIRAAMTAVTATSASMVGLTGAATGLTAATTTATAAQTGLNVAMRANPIGLVITALFALYEAYEYVSGAEKKRKEEMASLNRQIEAATLATKGMNDILRATDGSGFGKLAEAARVYGNDLQTLGSINDEIAKKQKEYADASTVYLEHGIKAFDDTTPKAQTLKKEIADLQSKAGELTGSMSGLEKQLIAAGASALVAAQSTAQYSKLAGDIIAAFNSGDIEALARAQKALADYGAGVGRAIDLDKKAADARDKAASHALQISEKLETAGKTQAQIAQMLGDKELAAAKATGTASAETLANIQKTTAARVAEAAKVDAATHKQKDLTKELQRATEQYNAAQLRTAELQSRALGELDPYQAALAKYRTEMMEAVKVAQDQIEKAQKLGKTHEATAQAVEMLNTRQAAALGTLQKTNKGLDQQADVLGRLKKQYADQASLVGLSERQRAIAQAVQMVTAQYDANTQAGIKNKQTLDELVEGTKQAAAADYDLEKASKDLDQTLSQFGQADPFQQLADSLVRVQDELKRVGDASSEAFDPQRVKELQTAVGNIRHAMVVSVVDSAQAGLRSLQSMSKEGSQAFQAMQIAIDALTVVQAISAVLNQGQGDPYTAFARMAAMAAAVVALGVDIGNFGGGGGQSSASAEVRQKSQGTSTVLGDVGAKSESIAKAIDITAKATTALVGINRGMLTALQALQNALGAAGNQLARGAGNASFPGVSSNVRGVGPLDPFGLGLDPISSALSSDPIGKALGGFLFGGKQKVIDQGIVIVGGTIQSMVDHIMVGAYQTIHKDGGLFGSDKTYDNVVGVSDQFSKQFQLVIGSIIDTVRAGATALGLLPADVEQRLAAFRVEEIRISLKGLSAEDQQKELEAVFSKIFDDLAASVVPFAAQFQQVGEGLGETLIRIATEVQVAQQAFQQLGLAVDQSNPEKFAQISDALISASGGLDNFISGLGSFFNNFASDAQKIAVESDALTSALGQVGLSLPATRAGMWDLMQTLDATTETGRAQIATLLRLADTANQYYDAIAQKESNIKSTLDGLRTNPSAGTWQATLDGINATYDTAIAKLKNYGATAAQIAEAEAGRSDAIASALQGATDAYNAIVQKLRAGMASLGNGGQSDLATQVAEIRAAEKATVDQMEAAARAANMQAASEQDLALAHEYADVQVKKLAQSVLDSIGIFGTGTSAFAKEIAGITSQAMQAKEALRVLGANTAELARVDMWASDQIAAAMSRLMARTQDLIANLFGGPAGTLDGVNAQIAALEAAMRGVGDAAGAATDALDAQAQAARKEIQLKIGDLSPYNDNQKLDIAKEAYLSGNASAEDVLGIAKRLFASSADYKAVFDWVMANPQAATGGGGGGGGGGGAGTSPELEALYKLRDELQANSAAEQRKAWAQELIQNIADMAAQNHIDALTQMDLLGVKLPDVIAALGIDLKNIDANGVLGLSDVSKTLGISLGDLLGRLGLGFDALHGGLLELADRMSIDLGNLNDENVKKLGDLAGVLDISMRDLLTGLGLGLGDISGGIEQMVAKLGIDLSDLSAGNVKQLGDLAGQLHLSLADVVGALHLNLTDLAGGLSDIAKQQGIDLGSLSDDSMKSLTELATNLHLSLADLGTALGLNLGGVTSAVAASTGVFGEKMTDLLTSHAVDVESVGTLTSAIDGMHSDIVDLPPRIAAASSDNGVVAALERVLAAVNRSADASDRSAAASERNLPTIAQNTGDTADATEQTARNTYDTASGVDELVRSSRAVTP